MIDINRDGLPDVLEAWPTNFRSPGFKLEYNECKDGVFVVDVGADPQDKDPQLACNPDKKTADTFDLRSARQHKAWVNRGIPGGMPGGALDFQHHCLDAGGVEPRTPTYHQISTPKGFGSREPTLFTQFGAEAVDEWGNGSMLWSLAGYHAFGIVPAKLHEKNAPPDSETYDEQTFLKFCPEFAAAPKHPALKWVKTGDAAWAKDAAGRDEQEFRHFNIVDIDGDGHGDLLTEPGTAGADGIFERAAIRFTRKISGLEQLDGTRGPSLHPFVPGSEEIPTVTPTFAEYAAYADVNGDGIVDLITASASSHGGAPEVRLGDGRGGFGCDPVQDSACQILGNGPGTGTWLGRAYLLSTPDRASPFDPKPWPMARDFDYQPRIATFFHDVTADGLADIIRYEPPTSATSAGKVRLWVNVDGRTFRCANSTDCVVATIGGGTLPTPLITGAHRILFTDIDGNGSEDFVLLGWKGMWTFSFLTVDAVPPSGPRSPRPGLLTRIRNGVGADTEVVYQTIQELDLAANSPDPQSFSRPWSMHLPQVLPIVTRLAVRDTSRAKGSPLAEPELSLGCLRALTGVASMASGWHRGNSISRLWPPAAATSSARLALSWPLMSLRSTSAAPASRIFGCGRASTWVPRK